MFLRIDGIEVKTRHSNGPGLGAAGFYVTTEKLKGGRSGSHTE
jgi:hypothetical protein